METTGLLFDLDGVIIDSESEYTRIWQKIDRHFPTGIENFASAIKGMTLTKILDDYYPDTSLRREVEELLYEEEKAMTYKFCRGAEFFIDRIISKGLARVIVTSSNKDKMAHLYRDIPAFKEMFPIIVESSQVKRSKPDPEGYLLAAHLINRDIRKCVVFEDSVQGVMAGQRSGAYVVGIKGTKKEEELSPYCHMISENLSDIDLEMLIDILKERT